MKELLLWLMCFIVVFLIYIVFVILNKKKLKKYNASTDVVYITRKYNIDLNKISNKKMAYTLSITNSLIIATTVSVVALFKNLFIQLLIGFILLILLILVVYDIVGRLLNKKYGK